MQPEKKVSEATDPTEALTLQASSLTLSVPHPKFLSYKAYHLPQTKLYLAKLGITSQDFPKGEIAWKEVVSHALDVSKKTHGIYITTMDLVASYLLLVEPTSKVLFNAKLKEEDILQILTWARIEYPQEEVLPEIHLHITGGGLAEGLLTGWTPETKKYTLNYTINLKRRPILVNREKEYQSLIDSLAKSENNNILLVGEAGVGKENLIQALAYDSYKGTLPDNLNYKTILELMVGQLIAGTKERGELEERLQFIIDEVSHSGNVILYLPEFQDIMGASSYQVDLSGALLPYLKEGKIPIVASMTDGNFKAYVEKHAIKEAFTELQIDEPEKNAAIVMLMEKAAEIEKQEKIPLTYKAIATAVTHADRYLQGSVLPGSAVRLLIDTAHTVAVAKDKKRPKFVMEDDVIAKVEEITKIKIAQPQGTEKEFLLNLEKKLHERVIGQNSAISSVAEAMRRLRTSQSVTSRPISFLFLGPTGVGKTETARALSDLYYGGEDNIIRLDMSEYGDEAGLTRLLGALPGQGQERGELTDKIHDHPSSLVLLDEFEKAHSKILDLFLQVLEDGRLTDNKGQTVSFSNAIIIATSNAGSEMIREAVQKGTTLDKAFQGTLLEFLQSNHLFKPELLNRFDDIVMYTPLDEKELSAITRLYLTELSKKYAEEDITVTFDDAVIGKIAKEGADPQFGARPLRRYIQDKIEDLIAQKKLKDEIKRGDRIAFGINETGDITVNT